jgi:ribonuclease HII
MNKFDLFAFQTELAAGAWPVCGVDEAGRGPLAGPVFAAAVILPPDLTLPGLDDSKKLTAKRREELYYLIRAEAVACGIDFATVAEIEELNILRAAMLAMKRAVARLDPVPALALIDGNCRPELSVPSLCVVGGDGKCASIAAASILAKVTRDRVMDALAEKYPQYGFEKHKGYGTEIHYAALRTYGPCPEHRPTFLRKLH